MDNNSKQWAVVMIGPPGCGKDTQADLLSAELGLTHVKTSKLLEAQFMHADPSDSEMMKERQKWATGELNSEALVIRVVTESIKEVYETGKGIIFSGSPRELNEAKVEMPELSKRYGKDNIKVVIISLSEDESVKRNSHRRVCEANRHSIPDIPENEGLTVCPRDGSPIVTRELDDQDIIRKRYQVFLEQTQPVVDFLTKEGYNIISVDGEQSIEDLHRAILNQLW